MGVKSVLAKPYASVVARSIRKWSNDAHRAQEYIFQQLVNKGRKTDFGKDHQFQNIATYNDFKSNVPINDYEGLRPYIDSIKEGGESVLWPGKPLYLAKTSGTTSGTKYIPLTKDSLPNHINSARNALLMYINETGNNSFVNGKMIFLSGSPVLDTMGSILTGRLSGIVNHHVPKYLKRSQLPTYQTNCIEDWETKINKIVEETYHHDMRLISGIPPWVVMYFENLIERTGKRSIKEIFPNFSLLVHGGVNFEPYKDKLFNLIGDKVDTIETYPASEGFIAFQDSQKAEGLLLNVDSGIFFEFIPSGEIFTENPTRIRLEDVETGKNYAIIINSNAGLWGYLIGDTIKFVNKNPHRIVVTGRVSHFISAFGEHVIGEEVAGALSETIKEIPAEVVEFTIAPQVSANSEKPYHEWFIEFSQQPPDLNQFIAKLDENLVKRNSYYADLIKGHILQPLKISLIQKNGFREYMKSKGKLGGQNKVPHLSNDRSFANELQKWKVN